MLLNCAILNAVCSLNDDVSDGSSRRLKITELSIDDENSHEIKFCVPLEVAMIAIVQNEAVAVVMNGTSIQKRPRHVTNAISDWQTGERAKKCCTHIRQCDGSVVVCWDKQTVLQIDNGSERVP